ncbi:MAG: SAM-dependent methyltransferase, partial [Nitrospirae bacterium]|nr:SAM-dependent methyltransferase [Nitrospirota bacterium]
MPSRKIFTAIFLSSFSALAFEITLTRIFSVSLWYHFAFMVISIAMLGIGVSGTLLTVYPKLKNLSNIGIYGLLLGVSISLCYIASNRIPFDPVRLSWDRIQLFYISLYYIALS